MLSCFIQFEHLCIYYFILLYFLYIALFLYYYVLMLTFCILCNTIALLPYEKTSNTTCRRLNIFSCKYFNNICDCVNCALLWSYRQRSWRQIHINSKILTKKYMTRILTINDLIVKLYLSFKWFPAADFYFLFSLQYTVSYIQLVICFMYYLYCL